MPSWSWMVLGALLLGAEMFVVDAQFYLVFLGVAAGVVGLVGWLGLMLHPGLQWLLFALLSMLAMTAFRKRLYELLRKPAEAVTSIMGVGERVTLPQALPPGQHCRVEYRASSWTVRNIDDHELSGEVEITQVEGLTLMVKRLSP